MVTARLELRQVLLEYRYTMGLTKHPAEELSLNTITPVTNPYLL